MRNFSTAIMVLIASTLYFISGGGPVAEMLDLDQDAHLSANAIPCPEDD